MDLNLNNNKKKTQDFYRQHIDNLALPVNLKRTIHKCVKLVEKELVIALKTKANIKSSKEIPNIKKKIRPVIKHAINKCKPTKETIITVEYIVDTFNQILQSTKQTENLRNK